MMHLWAHFLATSYAKLSAAGITAFGNLKWKPKNLRTPKTHQCRNWSLITGLGKISFKKQFWKRTRSRIRDVGTFTSLQGRQRLSTEVCRLSHTVVFKFRSSHQVMFGLVWFFNWWNQQSLNGCLHKCWILTNTQISSLYHKCFTK